MMIIYAANIHMGGGKVLLEALLKSLKKPCVLFSDARLKLKDPLAANVENISVKASIWKRFISEFDLRKRARSAKKVLCFGNLPPLFQLSAETDLFFQNTILLKRYSHLPFPLSTRIKHFIERAWLHWGICHISTVYVQSAVVREEFLKEFPNAKVVVAPFVEIGSLKQLATQPEFDFIYVASGDPHKNHSRLLKAWRLLADQGLCPSLVLTLPQANSELLALVSDLRNKGLKIYNFSDLSHDQVMDLYSRSRALVFPSLTESFGLPLIEAQGMGLPIIASELDYVREFTFPVQTFDPLSEKSIFRAVLRFLGMSSIEPQQKVSSAENFLKLINF